MYTDEVRVRLAPLFSHSKKHGWSVHDFLFSGGMLFKRIFYSKSTRCQIRKRSCVLMLSKRGKGSVGEDESGKKVKTTPDAGVRKKYQAHAPARTPLGNQAAVPHTLPSLPTINQLLIITAY
jgi:hypothetical protein